MILSDHHIRDLSLTGKTGIVKYITQTDGYALEEVLLQVETPDGRPMISPFNEATNTDDQGNRVISYGVTSYGYDIRLSNKFRLFDKPNDGRVVDPKNSDPDSYSTEYEADSIVIPPGGLLLGYSMERFIIPRNVLVVALGKSTYARMGALFNVTPLEPEWEGELVVEITNGSNLPLRVYANEGIGQLVFHATLDPCEISYADKGGKYQHQMGLTTSIV